MIRAALEATGAVVWACWLSVLAVVAIGLLRASWRDWRASRRVCQNCHRGEPHFFVSGGDLHGLRVCYDCMVAITEMRVHRDEVQG